MRLSDRFFRVAAAAAEQAGTASGPPAPDRIETSGVAFDKDDIQTARCVLTAALR